MRMLKLVSVLLLISSLSYANPFLGHKTYVKKLRKDCHLSSHKFSYKHTQKQWQDFFDKGLLENEILNICPKLKKEKLETIDINDIFDFVYKYAKDSKNIAF